MAEVITITQRFPARAESIRGWDRAGASGRLDPSVYRRRRLVVAAVVVLVMALAWTAVGAVFGIGDRAAAGPVSVASVEAPVEDTFYLVQPGDTLWSVASSLAGDGDVRKVVDQLVDANGGALIQAGQLIRLPAGG